MKDEPGNCDSNSKLKLCLGTENSSDYHGGESFDDDTSISVDRFRVSGNKYHDEAYSPGFSEKFCLEQWPIILPVIVF
jgi:hypothetical protein